MVGISSALMNQESSTTYYEDFMPPQEYPDPAPYFSSELTEEMSILMADINGYIDKTGVGRLRCRTPEAEHRPLGEDLAAGLRPVLRAQLT